MMLRPAHKPPFASRAYEPGEFWLRESQAGRSLLEGIHS